ncbi:MAG: protein translocase SEC61 complex subunit gamma [Candidatus Aenigmarchaeota archaeon]|nr:protein translocase SEC61 complex subunit gamma [Candidatus Aenigmarchaeota archaeon]
MEKTKFERLKEFLTECKRVLRVTKKPDREEFRTIVKISGLGMLVIGVVGFLVSVIKELVF